MIDNIHTVPIPLGPRTSHSLLNDPRHMSFVLSRYKFCARMLEGKGDILEIGCGDAFGSPIVAQVADTLTCIDNDDRLIDDNKGRLVGVGNMSFHTMDMITRIPDRVYDAIYLIDVIEHIDPSVEATFMDNICRCLDVDGILIIGTPNDTAVEYESTFSAARHINRKGHDSLKELVQRHFINSFTFSMNDEVVHTGFYPMAHYLLAMGVGLL